MWGIKAVHCIYINLSCLYVVIPVIGPAMRCSNVTSMLKNTKIFREKTLCLLVVNDVSEDRSASVFTVNSSKDRRR